MPKCRGCQKNIRWGIMPDGKKIPLDPSAPVYSIVAGSLAGEGELKIERHATALVSHFKTCPQACQFSARAASSLPLSLPLPLEDELNA